MTPLTSSSATASPVRLTKRELDVLRVVALGHQSREAADILFLSKRTIDFHLANVFEKLSVSNRLSAVRVATTLGMLPSER